MSYPVLSQMTAITQLVKQPTKGLCWVWPTRHNRGKWSSYATHPLNPLLNLAGTHVSQYLLLTDGELHFLSVGPNNELFDGESYHLAEISGAIVTQDNPHHRMQFRHGETDYDFLCSEFPLASTSFTPDEQQQFKDMTRLISSVIAAYKVPNTPFLHPHSANLC